MIHHLYRLYAADSTLLYVGISDNLGRRLREHSKREWWPDIASTSFEQFDSRMEAERAEVKAIRNEHPKHNVVHNLPDLYLVATEVGEPDAEPVRLTIWERPEGHPNLIGYARVNDTGPRDQEYVQLDALVGANCGRIYVDRVSRQRDPRPLFAEMCRGLVAGDVVVVTELERVGRTIVDLVNILDAWSKSGVSFVAVKQGIDSSTDAGRMVCSTLAAFAEFGRSRNKERTSAALAARRARGITGGRPSKVTAESLAKAERLLAAGIPLAEAAAAIGIGRSTLGRHRLAAARAARRQSVRLEA